MPSNCVNAKTTFGIRKGQYNIHDTKSYELPKRRNEGKSCRRFHAIKLCECQKFHLEYEIDNTTYTIRSRMNCSNGLMTVLCSARFGFLFPM